MKVYQLLEIGGSYEDSYEYTIGMFSNKNKALEIKKIKEQNLENKIKQYEICYECVSLDIEERKKNKCFQQYIGETYDYYDECDCKNEVDYEDDEIHYEIREFEVID